MGATSGAHTAAEVVMTNLSSRTRVHRPAEFALAGIEVATEAVSAATLSRVGLSSRKDERQVPVLQLGPEADSDPPGRSITSLVEEGATQGFVG
jgi:hypothetical protein